LDNGSFIQEYPSGASLFTEFEAFCGDPLQGLTYGQNLIYQIQDPTTLDLHSGEAGLSHPLTVSGRGDLESDPGTDSRGLGGSLRFAALAPPALIGRAR
jgi:hypothetical protein